MSISLSGSDFGSDGESSLEIDYSEQITAPRRHTEYAPSKNWQKSNFGEQFVGAMGAFGGGGSDPYSFQIDMDLSKFAPSPGSKGTRDSTHSFSTKKSPTAAKPATTQSDNRRHTAPVRKSLESPSNKKKQHGRSKESPKAKPPSPTSQGSGDDSSFAAFLEDSSVSSALSGNARHNKSIPPHSIQSQQLSTKQQKEGAGAGQRTEEDDPSSLQSSRTSSSSSPSISAPTFSSHTSPRKVAKGEKKKGRVARSGSPSESMPTDRDRNRYEAGEATGSSTERDRDQRREREETVKGDDESSAKGLFGAGEKLRHLSSLSSVSSSPSQTAREREQAQIKKAVDPEEKAKGGGAEGNSQGPPQQLLRRKSSGKFSPAPSGALTPRQRSLSNIALSVGGLTKRTTDAEEEDLTSNKNIIDRPSRRQSEITAAERAKETDKDRDMAKVSFGKIPAVNRRTSLPDQPSSLRNFRSPSLASSIKYEEDFEAPSSEEGGDAQTPTAALPRLGSRLSSIRAASVKDSAPLPAGITTPTGGRGATGPSAGRPVTAVAVGDSRSPFASLRGTQLRSFSSQEVARGQTDAPLSPSSVRPGSAGRNNKANPGSRTSAGVTTDGGDPLSATVRNVNWSQEAAARDRGGYSGVPPHAAGGPPYSHQYQQSPQWTGDHQGIPRLSPGASGFHSHSTDPHVPPSGQYHWNPTEMSPLNCPPQSPWSPYPGSINAYPGGQPGWGASGGHPPYCSPPSVPPYGSPAAFAPPPRNYGGGHWGGTWGPPGIHSSKTFRVLHPSPAVSPPWREEVVVEVHQGGGVNSVGATGMTDREQKGRGSGRTVGIQAMPPQDAGTQCDDLPVPPNPYTGMPLPAAHNNFGGSPLPMPAGSPLMCNAASAASLGSPYFSPHPHAATALSLGGLVRNGWNTCVSDPLGSQRLLSQPAPLFPYSHSAPPFGFSAADPVGSPTALAARHQGAGLVQGVAELLNRLQREMKEDRQGGKRKEETQETGAGDSGKVEGRRRSSGGGPMFPHQEDAPPVSTGVEQRSSSEEGGGWGNFAGVDEDRDGEMDSVVEEGLREEGDGDGGWSSAFASENGEAQGEKGRGGKAERVSIDSGEESIGLSEMFHDDGADPIRGDSGAAKRMSQQSAATQSAGKRHSVASQSVHNDSPPPQPHARLLSQDCASERGGHKEAAAADSSSAAERDLLVQLLRRLAEGNFGKGIEERGGKQGGIRESAQKSPVEEDLRAVAASLAGVLSSSAPPPHSQALPVSGASFGFHGRSSHAPVSSVRAATQGGGILGEREMRSRPPRSRLMEALSMQGWEEGIKQQLEAMRSSLLRQRLLSEERQRSEQRRGLMMKEKDSRHKRDKPHTRQKKQSGGKGRGGRGGSCSITSMQDDTYATTQGLREQIDQCLRIKNISSSGAFS